MNVRESSSKMTPTDAKSMATFSSSQNNSKSTKNSGKKSNKNSGSKSIVKDNTSSPVNNKSMNSNDSNSSSKYSNAGKTKNKKNSSKNSTTKSTGNKTGSSKYSANSQSNNSSYSSSNITSSPIKEEASKVRKKSIINKKIKKGQIESDQSTKTDQLIIQSTDFDQQNYQIESFNCLLEDQSILNSASTMNSPYFASNQASQSGWYTNEIKNIMHGFGDSPNPNPETLRLVEQIVHQQITCLLRLACDIAIQRQSKQIGLEEFIFLLRKDKVKLCRLLRHFNLKDMRNRLSSEDWTENQSSLDENVSTLDAGCTMDFDEEELLNALILEQKTNQTSTSLQPDAAQQSTTSTHTRATVFPQPAKRLELCLDFLASIDQTGELDRYLQEDQFFDELKHNRTLRIEEMTRFMSQKEYLNFYKARQTSFANRLQPNKFRDWLYNVPFNQLDTNQWPIKPNALAIEILQYFAYETIAILVDLALIIKQDQQKTTDPVSKLVYANAHTDSFPLLNSNLSTFTVDSTANSYASPSSLSSTTNKHTNLTNLLNSSSSSMSSSFNNQSILDQQQKTSKTILPTPFFFSSTNVNTKNECPFFSIKPQEIREVIRRYLNANPRGTLSSVLLFGIDQSCNQPFLARSKVMCL